MRFRGRERTGAGISVAIIDSGIDAMDPRVSGHKISGWNIGLGATGHALIGADSSDVHGNGTTMAAAVSAVAPAVDMIGIRIMDEALRTSADLMAAGIETAYRNGARIISLSMGTPNMGKALLLRDACALAVESGAVVLARLIPGGNAPIRRTFQKRSGLPRILIVVSTAFSLSTRSVSTQRVGAFVGQVSGSGVRGWLGGRPCLSRVGDCDRAHGWSWHALRRPCPLRPHKVLMTALADRALLPIPEMGYS